MDIAEVRMWKKFEEEKPECSGWILLSTNKGLAYALYNKENNNLNKLSLFGDAFNQPTEWKHWAKIDPQPEGDYDPNSIGFQKIVR